VIQWQQLTHYGVGDYVHSSQNDNVYVCVVAGISRDTGDGPTGEGHIHDGVEPNVVEWDHVPADPTVLFVYFDDDVALPAFGDCPPEGRNPFDGEGNYPGAVCYHEQRLVLAGSLNAPATVQMSRSGLYKNFDRSIPANSDDAIDFTIASGRLDPIRSLLSLRALLLLTADAEYIVTSGGQGPMTPAAVEAKAQSRHGASWLDPIAVGQVSLWVQQRGRCVRELLYDYSTDGYGGNDLTILVPHLFEGHTIVAWAYQRIPESILWCIRDDGALLALTYLREHQVWGWSQHFTGPGESAEDPIRLDRFESVCTIPEGEVDVTYFVVQRKMDYGWRRFVERLATREITSLARDAFFVDCGLTYNGRNLTETTVAIEEDMDPPATPPIDWPAGTRLVISSAEPVFADVILDDEIQVRDAALVTHRFPVWEITDSRHVRVHSSGPVPSDLHWTETPYWAIAKKLFSGADHLNGKTVAILADGDVADRATVLGGSFALVRPAAVVHAGLPYTCYAETLNLAVDPNTRGALKLLSRVGLELDAARGLWYGENGAPLIEWKQRQELDGYASIQAASEMAMVYINSSWNTGGRLAIEQRDPVPVTVLGIHPEFKVGG
jgi:hypothetical protein